MKETIAGTMWYLPGYIAPTPLFPVERVEITIAHNIIPEENSR